MNVFISPRYFRVGNTFIHWFLICFYPPSGRVSLDFSPILPQYRGEV